MWQLKNEKTVKIEIEHRTQGRKQIFKGRSWTTEKKNRSSVKQIFWSK
jgi:hypothetical protein